MDGEKGILRYRGYSIEDLAEKANFLEVAYLLIFGDLPNAEELEKFHNDIKAHVLLYHYEIFLIPQHSVNHQKLVNKQLLKNLLFQLNLQ